MLRFALFLLSSVCAVATFADATAGAFMAAQGQGQFIAGVGYSAGSRSFDASGTAVPSPTERKAIVGGYLEYGLTNWITLVAAPTLARSNFVATNSVTGSDSSALGARVQLYGTYDTVVAVQALVQPPVGNSDQASIIANGGARTFAADFRLLYGLSFSLMGLPAFVDLEPGARVRVDPLPDEARLDLTFGIRPIPRLMLLVQDFSAYAPSRGPLIARTAYSKAQVSLVYDLSTRWSLQAGVFRTMAGRNAIREMGPMAALWYRF